MLRLRKERLRGKQFQLKKLQLELERRAKESQSHTAVDGSGDHTTSHVYKLRQ